MNRFFFDLPQNLYTGLSLTSEKSLRLLLLLQLQSVLLVPLNQLLRPAITSSVWSPTSHGKLRMGIHVLPARVPLPGLGLSRPGFPPGAEVPGDGDDAEHDGARNQRVAAPVGRLCVPTTSR